jgi:proton glutamate symport protein
MTDERRRRIDFKELAHSINRPWITIAAVVIACALGASRHPLVQYLRPIGDFYLALLQMCVLPFLLATIPLAVRSAMASGAIGNVLRALVIAIGGTMVVVALLSVLIPSVIFTFAHIDEQAIARIGALIGESADRVDIEFTLDAARELAASDGGKAAITTIVPTNIFASLSGNDSIQVLVFAAIFGLGMVATERHSGYSVFSALEHIQAVCIRIFDWFNVLVPIGVIALIAPQIARLGPDAHAVLALFAYAFLATSLIIMLVAVVVIASILRIGPLAVCSALLAPVMLGAASRNTLVCIPLALETVTQRFHIARQPSDLYIPLGFTAVRFGSIVFFCVAALFMGMLLGRSFGPLDILLIAALSVVASFATIGVGGLAALAPLAAVLRPFGLSYELAVPLMIVLDPVINMVRVMINVLVNCLVLVIAARPEPPAPQAVPVAV